MNSTQVLILGAGPAGLTLALYLRDLGVDSHILEKSDTAGGLARSFKVGPYTFDHSGHLLHTRNAEVLDLVQKRLKVNLRKIARQSVCYVDGKFIPFPYQQNIFYLNAGMSREALFEYFRKKIERPRNFREWIEASYGNGVGRQFLYPYNSKLWNTNLRRMAVDWVPRFLPASGAAEILKSAFYREKDPWGYNAMFYYPAYGGIGTIGRRLAEEVGYRTTLNAIIRKIDLKKKRVVLIDGSVWRYENLVSTIPLPEFLRLSGLPPSPLLRSTGVTVFNVGLKQTFDHEFHWCYVSQPAIPFYRFGVYSNISSRSAPTGHAALYIECASSPRKLRRFRFSGVLRHLMRMKLVHAKKDVAAVHRLDLRYAYPVPLLGLARYRESLQKRLATSNVELMGRFGAWKYVAISDVMAEAKILARRLARHLAGT